jgi:ferrous iron transport protein A
MDVSMLLSHLPIGQPAVVTCLTRADVDMDDAVLRRLGDLGFIEGEPLQLLRKGPGGREPLAVQVGETLFALRLQEAQCIEVQLVEAQ